MNRVERDYSTVRSLLKAAWSAHRSAEKARGEPVPNIRQIALKIGVSASAFNAWLLGQRAPREDHIQKLANQLYGDNAEDRELFKSDLTIAVRATIDPYERVQSAQGPPVRVGVVKYGYFETFLWAIFERFASFAALGSAGPTTQTHVDLQDVPRQLCKTRDLDICLGIFATPDRALSMKFIHTPIRIPVNAVIRSDHLKGRSEQEFREALFGHSPGASNTILPIVNSMEVGGLHVRYYLRCRDQDTQNVPYDIAAYIEALRSAQALSGRTPIVVADEFACAQICAQWPGPPSSKPKLLFTEKDDEYYAPFYHLAIAVSRHYPMWYTYLNEAWDLFLAANIEFVARQYDHLRTHLTEQLAQVFPKASTMARHGPNAWLGLARNIDVESSIMSACWRPILDSAENLRRVADGLQSGASRPARRPARKTS